MTVQELIDQLVELDPSADVWVDDDAKASLVAGTYGAQGNVYLTIIDPL